MRLGQLTRKLALRPGEIVEFLANKNIQIDDGANTRLDEEHVHLILTRYAPDLLIVPAPVLEEKKEQVPANVETEPIDNGLPEEHLYLVPVEDETPKSEQEGETAEIIKVPKISLTGLKVLGKIDLPEPKKKDTQQDPTPETPGDLQDEKEKKLVDGAATNFNRKSQRPHQRSIKNPIALQREKEAQEEQMKRKEKVEREKEKRKQNYYKKVKMSPPTKAVKMVEEETMQMSAEELAEPPKTWFGRFLRWLTT